LAWKRPRVSYVFICLVIPASFMPSTPAPAHAWGPPAAFPTQPNQVVHCVPRPAAASATAAYTAFRARQQQRPHTVAGLMARDGNRGVRPFPHPHHCPHQQHQQHTYARPDGLPTRLIEKAAKETSRSYSHPIGGLISRHSIYSEGDGSPSAHEINICRRSERHRRLKSNQVPERPARPTSNFLALVKNERWRIYSR
jgi:hypothetical protein